MQSSLPRKQTSKDWFLLENLNAEACIKLFFHILFFLNGLISETFFYIYI